MEFTHDKVVPYFTEDNGFVDARPSWRSFEYLNGSHSGLVYPSGNARWVEAGVLRNLIESSQDIGDIWECVPKMYKDIWNLT